MTKIKCTFNINNISKTISIHEDKPLIFVIRDEFGLTGTKLGCSLEQCGSCAVLVDGDKKLSCNSLAKNFQNSQIITIEGLGNEKDLNIVQENFKRYNAAQCGYCTSGIIISLTALFNKSTKPTKEDVIRSLEGHLCRCGSHNSIFQAINAIKKELA
ncbi:2Fe-2S iron-sulfur cluster-binding protein [Alphaproteobacteria bacterium]|nr:2Fe-2S iron-sulfur cluster-binding protein [Alphaproteobacteria bacterium]MDC1023195.1 2Fe-2S iron-sulfur cluster-binding protein [Alphaproteobacteria bacterium]